MICRTFNKEIYYARVLYPTHLYNIYIYSPLVLSVLPDRAGGGGAGGAPHTQPQSGRSRQYQGRPLLHNKNQNPLKLWQEAEVRGGVYLGAGAGVSCLLASLLVGWLVVRRRGRGRGRRREGEPLLPTSKQLLLPTIYSETFRYAVLVFSCAATLHVIMYFFSFSVCPIHSNMNSKFQIQTHKSTYKLTRQYWIWFG